MAAPIRTVPARRPARRQDLEHGEGIRQGDHAEDVGSREVARENAEMQVRTEPEEQQDSQLRRPAGEPEAA